MYNYVTDVNVCSHFAINVRGALRAMLRRHTRISTSPSSSSAAAAAATASSGGLKIIRAAMSWNYKLD